MRLTILGSRYVNGIALSLRLYRFVSGYALCFEHNNRRRSTMASKERDQGTRDERKVCPLLVDLCIQLQACDSVHPHLDLPATLTV